jgi:glycine betaine/proline transport system substrate-binding protein
LCRLIGGEGGPPEGIAEREPQSSAAQAQTSTVGGKFTMSLGKFLTASAAALLLISDAVSLPARAGGVPESTDPIKLAINEWTGQHITTYIAGDILRRMGYNVEYTTAGYLPQFEAIQDGTVTASLEIWSNNVGESYDKAAATGKVVRLGDLGLEAGEGWYYPKYVEEKCPGLPDWNALTKCAEIFSTPETFPEGRLLDYPLDWGARNVDVIKALKLPFTSVPGGSEGALVAEFKAATERKEPILMMFWTPHWLFAQVPDMRRVDLPAYDDACLSDATWGPNPDVTGDCFVPSPTTFKVAWAGAKDKWPAAYRFLTIFTLSAEDQIPLIESIDSQGQDLETVVKAWVDANEAKWKPMVDQAMATN